MSARRWSIAALAASFFGLASGAWAQAPTVLTGTYEGTVSCKLDHADTGATGSFQLDSELLIRQVSAGAMGAQLAVVVGPQAFSGRSIDTGVGKGEVVFVRCGSGDSAWSQPTEIWKSKFKINAAKASGTITGTSVFNDANGSPTQGTIVTCKGKWKLVDPAEPDDVFSCEDL